MIDPVGRPRSVATGPDLSREQILVLLRANPTAIAAAVAGFGDTILARDPAPGEWSVTTILAHLRACSDQWGGACLAILASDRPTIRAISPRSWVKRTDHAQQPFSVSLAAFRAQRDALLAVLQPLPADAWSRSAVVTGAGPVLERTLTSYALGLADHERRHVLSVERLAAALRAESV